MDEIEKRALQISRVTSMLRRQRMNECMAYSASQVDPHTWEGGLGPVSGVGNGEVHYNGRSQKSGVTDIQTISRDLPWLGCEIR